MTTQASTQSVLVLGAGLTGMATAWHLRQQGFRVTLLDHPEWQDGFQCNASDPAPVMFGRQRETRRLLHSLNSAPPDRDTTLPLEFRLSSGRIVAYRSTHLPGALQWMTSLFTFHGLAWNDRWKLFSHVEQIWEQAQSLPADLESRTADEWLTSIGQSESARIDIWHPLARWLTGNPLMRLSAAIFVQLLSAVFLGEAIDARLTHVQGSIGNRLIAPLRRTLVWSDTVIHQLNDVPRIGFEPQGISGLHMNDGTVLRAEWYVTAVPHHKLLALLPERLLTRYAYFAQLGDLNVLSDIKIQLTCRAAAQRPRLILLAGQPFQQLALTPQEPDHMVCRFSAIGNSTVNDIPDDQIASLAKRELRPADHGIATDEVLDVQVFRDKVAALSLQPGANLIRPIQRSPVSNLLVAGAWTDTGWPANVESALISARRCADAITKAVG